MYVEMTPGSGGGSSTKIFKQYIAAKADIPSTIVCTDEATGVTFRPTYIELIGIYNTQHSMCILYDEEYSSTKFRRWLQTNLNEFTISTSETNAGITSITSTGFTLNTNGKNQTKLQIFAMA